MAGCVTVTQVDLGLLYQAGYVAYVTREGSLPTDIRGKPFGDNPQINDQMRAQMALPLWHQATTFTAAKPGNRRGHRLMLFFDPADATFNGQRACRGEDVKSRPPQGEMHIQAAFCSRRAVVSEAVVEGPRPANPGDPAFRRMMDQLLAELMPSQNDSHYGECATPPCD